VNGIKTRDLVAVCAKTRGRGVDIEALAREVNFVDFLDRDVNHKFSGGEIKRSELLQLMAQDPDLILLDEPESGVDLENMSLIGETINLLLHRALKCAKGRSHRQMGADQNKSALIITHTGHILDYITADRGQVLFNGHLCCSRNAREILKWIGEFGYEECVRCTMDLPM
jgi:Fe-S cluster assembly ATP-binding protein